MHIFPIFASELNVSNLQLRHASLDPSRWLSILRWQLRLRSSEVLFSDYPCWDLDAV